MEAIRQYLKSVAGIVGRMTPSQVMMLLGVVAGTLVGGILLVGWLSDVRYSRLYSGLDEAEAGEVIAYLNEAKTPYRLSDGGRAIEVPADEVYQVRLSLASEGLPRSANMGYSIFDQTNLGMTDFLQNLNFRRALEGELTKTIMKLNEIDAARVHIVMPEERLFKEDQKEATASVVVKLKRGGALAERQVAGITHLVASSVEGLEPDNITIVDYDGNLLSSGERRDPIAGLSASQLDVVRQVETHLEDKAQSMLAEVLGPDRSVVRVTAELNFQQVERTSETFDPNTPSVRSEERTTASSSATDKAMEESESQQEDNSETVVTNYELNKTVEHLVNAVGSIERLSVAVLVDGKYTPSGGEGQGGEMIYEPRSAEELERLESIVRNAVGFNGERSDQIEMVNIAFDRRNLGQQQELLDSMYLREFYWDIAQKIGYVLLLAVLLLYFRKKAKRLFAGLRALAPPARSAPVASPSIQHDAVGEEQSVAAEEQRSVRLADRMQEAAREQPEEVARVIKTMMAD